MSDYQVSRFTSAVIARNGSMLEPTQVAAMRGCTVEELDRWVQSRPESELSELAGWLDEHSQEMERLVQIEQSGMVPSVVEHLHLKLCTSARTLPCGKRWPMPGTGRYRAKNAADAIDHMLGRKGGA